jgi:hypothetical protein
MTYLGEAGAGAQDLVDDALSNLTQAQVIGLLDDERYRGWIKTELLEREAYKKIKEEEDV